MHEWALAEGVIARALDLCKERGLREVTRLVVRIGELQRIGPECFRDALLSVMPQDDPRLAAMEIVLEVERANFDCRKCGRSFSLADAQGELDHEQQEAIHFVPELAHGFLGCPGCRSPDFAVSRGRGIWLDKLEGRT